jgi:hypothetical protein
MRIAAFTLLSLAVHSVLATSTTAQLVQIHVGFTRDPGWDHYQSRIVGIEMPTTVEVPYPHKHAGRRY